MEMMGAREGTRPASAIVFGDGEGAVNMRQAWAKDSRMASRKQLLARQMRVEGAVCAGQTQRRRMRHHRVGAA